MKRVLVDTGPLVALLSAPDQFHESCVAALSTMAVPLYTCWPVLTEAAWLLRSNPAAFESLLGSAAAGLFKILSLTEGDASAIATVLKRYRSLKPDLADAALVHLAQRERIYTIFTLDRRDFRVYRPARSRAFRIEPYEATASYIEIGHAHRTDHSRGAGASTQPAGGRGGRRAP